MFPSYRYEVIQLKDIPKSRSSQLGEVAHDGDDAHLYDYIENPVALASSDFSGIELTPCAAYGAPHVSIRAKPPGTDPV